MTDTADAAKLRDNLTKLLAHIEDGPYIGAEGVADVVLNWVKENIPNLSLQLARGNLQNTRPQPSPPEDEPDEATIERVAEAIAMAGTSHFGDDTPYAQQNHLVKMMRRYEAKAAIEAYGLAARSKIEDKS